MNTVQDVFNRNSPRFHQVALKEHIKVLTWKSLCSSHSPARAWHIYRHVHKLVCLCSQCSVKSLNSHSPAAFTPLSSEHQGSEVCFVPLSFVRFQAERCDWLLVARGAEPLIVRGGSSQLICSQLEQSVNRRLAAQRLFILGRRSFWLPETFTANHTHTHTHTEILFHFLELNPEKRISLGDRLSWRWWCLSPHECWWRVIFSGLSPQTPPLL